MKMKKLTALASALVLGVTGMTSGMAYSSASAEEVKYNYGEALQKSLFFYQVQQAGELPEWNEVSWRDDSMLTDVVQGGWFDAGDHFKFALTNAYAAYNLAWGLIEYEDAVKSAGLYDHYLRNVKWGIDYVLGCDLGDKIVGTIGHPQMDHVWWGSAELYERKMALQYGETERPYDTIENTSTMADMASALATGYILFKDSDPATAEEYLTHAVSLFERADALRSNEDQGVQKSYYNNKQSGSDADFADELMLAANWLYRATGDEAYLTKCETDYIPLLGRESQSTDLKYSWGYCWDDVMQAAILLYAQNTGEQQWIDHVKKHLGYWMGEGPKPFEGTYTPDGLAWLMNWGANRHSANTCWIALLASDTIFADDAALVEKYTTWATGQLNYMFGDNDLGLSYVMGMGEKNPINIHHRTTSGIYDDHWNELGKLNEDGTPYEDPKWQTQYAHVCYGALIGGPAQDGSFKDENAAYEHTEVAIDYNAGFTAALCAMIEEYGGEKLADFPVEETPKWAEFLMKASFNQNSDSYTELKVYAMNHSAWPSRTIQNLSYNYYFDITEIVDKGFSISDVQVKINNDQHSGDEGKCTISDPIQYDGNIYYVKITFGDGRVVMPTGQSEHRSELQFRVSIPDSLKDADGNKVTWDATNDYSAQGLVQGGEDSMIETPYITMYDGDVLIWGTEPDGTEPDDNPITTTKPTETTTTTTTTTTGELTTTATSTDVTDITEDTTTTTTVTKGTESTTSTTATSGDLPQADYGDVNLDGQKTMIDLVYMNKKMAGLIDFVPQQTANADCFADGLILGNDATALLQFLIEKIDTLPVIG